MPFPWTFTQHHSFLLFQSHNWVGVPSADGCWQQIFFLSLWLGKANKLSWAGEWLHLRRRSRSAGKGGEKAGVFYRKMAKGKRSEACREGWEGKCTMSGKTSVTVWAPAYPWVTYFILRQHSKQGMRRDWWIIEEEMAAFLSFTLSPSATPPPTHPSFFYFNCGTKKDFINNLRDFFGVCCWRGGHVACSRQRYVSRECARERQKLVECECISSRQRDISGYFCSRCTLNCKNRRAGFSFSRFKNAHLCNDWPRRGALLLIAWRYHPLYVPSRLWANSELLDEVA